MLRNISEVCGSKISASDGEVGHVKDFIFDDQTWIIRYLIADTGSWLVGRLVLLFPHGIDRFDPAASSLSVNLSKRQIESSPSLEIARRVSRQYEIDYARYFGIPTYWNRRSVWGEEDANPVLLPPMVPADATPTEFVHRDDKHLQSTHDVIGYQVHTADGCIGKVSGYMIDDQNWAICEVVIGSDQSEAGKELRIPICKIERISCRK